MPVRSGIREFDERNQSLGPYRKENKDLNVEVTDNEALAVYAHYVN